MRRLCIFLVVLGAPAWMPGAFLSGAGEAPGPIAAAPDTFAAAAVTPASVAIVATIPPTVGAGPPTVRAGPPTVRAVPPTVRAVPRVVRAPSRPLVAATRPRPDAAAAATSFGPARLTAARPLRPRPLRPALAADFPDPDVIRVGSTWWAYATGSGFTDLQARSSSDLVTWSAPVDPLPHLPAWAAPGFSWAPAVMASGSGFLMYYSIRDAILGRQCLSVASSPTPAGPFVDFSARPLTCQAGSGGSIDPEPFTAPDGSRYLLWKSEDNALGLASRIGAQRLAPGGLGLVGDRPRLLTATAAWQSGVVEGPSMTAAEGRYYLFYGGNHWNTTGAGIGYAVCATPIGPCIDRSRGRPWLGSTAGAVGPSGPDIFTGPDGQEWLAFHAWSGQPPAGESASPARALWILPLTFVDGTPVIG